MFLPHFSIIVACDSQNGIAKDGGIPWNNTAAGQFFNDTTRGSGDNSNVVIYGRKTYECFPPSRKVLDGRYNCIITNTLKQEHTPNITIFPTLIQALSNLGTRYKNIFVIGGEQLFNEAIDKYLYLIDRVYVTKLKTSYQCTKFFPFEKIKDFPQEIQPIKSIDWTRSIFNPSKVVKHPEVQYINLLERVERIGENRPDSTGIGTKTLFSQSLTFDLTGGPNGDGCIPFISVMQLPVDTIIKEALMYMTGNTDAREMTDFLGHRWSSLTTKKALHDAGKKYVPGDMGPTVGWEWINWGQDYRGLENKDREGFDQLSPLLTALRDTPLVGPHVLVAWDPCNAESALVPQYEIMLQFFVSLDKQFIDCALTLSRSNVFAETPYLIGVYSVIHAIVAHLSGMRPRSFSVNIGEAYVMMNMMNNIEKVLSRTPRPWGKLKIIDGDRVQTLSKITTNNISIEGYNSWSFVTTG